jgi:hypothetical protein
MIDTIILRLHGLSKYESLIKGLDVLDIQGYTTGMGKLGVARDVCHEKKRNATGSNI